MLALLKDEWDNDERRLDDLIIPSCFYSPRAKQTKSCF